MGCPDFVLLGNNITFSVVTHDADTAGRTDASACTYKIYEDDTGTAILSGSMTKHDSETGFYLEKIAVSAGNGFETNKKYNILVEATVDSKDGGLSFGFMVLDGLIPTGYEPVALDSKITKTVDADSVITTAIEMESLAL